MDETGDLRCGACGPVALPASGVEVHANAREGFRLLVTPCPGCGELIASNGADVIERALAAGATRRELYTPLPPLASDDLLELHLSLADEDWCARLIAGA